MSEAPPEVVDQLYGGPPDEFIARRDARAKELRKGGDRAAADAVKKLRKPSVSAAAVNRLARSSFARASRCATNSSGAAA